VTIYIFFKDFIYLFEREQARAGQRERKKQTPRQAGSPMQGMQGSILGP